MRDAAKDARRERNGQMLLSSRSLHRKTIEKQSSGMQKNVLCNFKNQWHTPVASWQMFRQTGPRNSWRALGLDATLQYERPGHFCSPPAPSGHCRCLWHGLFAPCTETKHNMVDFFTQSDLWNSTRPFLVPRWFPYSSTLNHIKRKLVY